MSGYIETLIKFVRQPSISSDGTGIYEMADMLREEMNRAGIETKVLESAPDGYPIVFGVTSKRNKDKTLLIYGHYDVHPVGNLSDWKVDPFSAEISGDKIFGRGAVDNKGNFLAWIKAVELFREIGFEFPLNLIFLIEGEEEIGSPNLAEFVNNHKGILSEADAKVVFEPRQDVKGKAFINLGWKGSLLLKLTAYNKGGQIHSSYASVVSNPLWQMIEAVHSMTDGTSVKLSGFYEKMDALSEKEKDLLRQLRWDKEDLISALDGEPLKIPELEGLPLRQRFLLEPYLNVSAFSAGSTEPPVAVIPASASCLLEFRLVPSQRCTEVIDLVKKHLWEKDNYHNIHIEVLSTTEPSRTSVDEDVVQSVRKACELTFGTCDVYPIMQGISPDYLFTQKLRIPSVGCGCGYHHLCHRPNEYITVSQFSKGVELACNIIMEFAKRSQSKQSLC